MLLQIFSVLCMCCAHAVGLALPQKLMELNEPLVVEHQQRTSFVGHLHHMNTRDTGLKHIVWIGPVVLAVFLLTAVGCIFVGRWQPNDKRSRARYDRHRSHSSEIANTDDNQQASSSKEDLPQAEHSARGQEAVPTIAALEHNRSDQSMDDSQTTESTPLSDQTRGTAPADRANLSPDLVVSDPDGWMIIIPRDLSPEGEDSVINIREVNTGKTVLRAFVSEKSAEPGTLFETADYTPVAFLDTAKAVRQRGVIGQQTGREAILRFASTSGWDRKNVYCVFFMNTNIYGTTIVARRRSSSGRTGPELLSGDISDEGAVVKMRDVTGRCLAEMDTSQESAVSTRGYMYRVSEGVDAGLVVSTVFAAQRLK